MSTSSVRAPRCLKGSCKVGEGAFLLWAGQTSPEAFYFFLGGGFRRMEATENIPGEWREVFVRCFGPGTILEGNVNSQLEPFCTKDQNTGQNLANFQEVAVPMKTRIVWPLEGGLVSGHRRRHLRAESRGTEGLCKVPTASSLTQWEEGRERFILRNRFM